jgi:hypothetical protein
MTVSLLNLAALTALISMPFSDIISRG